MSNLLCNRKLEVKRLAAQPSEPLTGVENIGSFSAWGFEFCLHKLDLPLAH
jgi:hypothetical protein